MSAGMQSAARRVVAVVPARAGSQGLPGKNLMRIGDHSLVGWAVRAARDAGIDDVVLTTDGAALAAEGRRLGCTVVDRPAELATSSSRTVDAVLHVITALRLPADTWVVLLQPTSPLRTGDDVRATLARHAAGDVRTTLTGCPVPHHPLKQLLLDDDGSARPVGTWPDLEAPRQLLPRAVRPNGAVYVSEAGVVAAAGSVVVAPLAVVEMPEWRSLDVDTADDLTEARARAAGDPQAAGA